MIQKKYRYQPQEYFMAWAVHIFTASAAYIGIFALVNIYQHHYLKALWLMGITVVIDAIDGSFARRVQVKKILPRIDGTLLDNMVDYLNYVIVPCVFLLVNTEMLLNTYAPWIIAAITMTSSYQFCQSDAKTPDHFFKGFPCYWNFAVFYMFIFNSSPLLNTLIFSLLCILIFVPIKYVYPSRLDYLTSSKQLKWVMHSCSLLYGISSSFLLWDYPTENTLWLSLSLGYIALYLTLSIYRTYSPMIMAKINSHR